ncbi:MAG: hypothetical protein NTV06_01990 [candidate division Zixibacteria bacterium]|nr:hypothetical protein [candidate division Zixibacteria bacterium]
MGEVILSEIGRIVDNFWREIPDHYNNVDIDSHIIMPDHIHGIIIIKDDGFLAAGGNHIIAPESGRTGQCPVPTKNKHFGLLSKVIKSFKNAITTTIRSNCGDYNFRWQRSFYDHAIRNEEELTKIREYIINNPIQQELTGRVTDKRLF